MDVVLSVKSNDGSRCFSLEPQFIQTVLESKPDHHPGIASRTAEFSLRGLRHALSLRPGKKFIAKGYERYATHRGNRRIQRQLLAIAGAHRRILRATSRPLFGMDDGHIPPGIFNCPASHERRCASQTQTLPSRAFGYSVVQQDVCTGFRSSLHRNGAAHEIPFSTDTRRAVGLQYRRPASQRHTSRHRSRHPHSPLRHRCTTASTPSH